MRGEDRLIGSISLPARTQVCVAPGLER